MMGKEFLPLFLDFNETTQDLTDDQCGRLVRALVDYANGNEYHLDGMELLAFRFLKGSIDRNERLSAIRAEAGSKGGKQSQANASKNKQTEASESKAEQKYINNDNDNKNKNDNDNKFDRFWIAYPRHVAKPTARKEFQKLNPDDELLTVMIRAIEQQKQSDQWTKDGGQYIPHPSTWIHQRRWEDEMKPVAVIRPVISQQYEQRDYSSVQDEILSEQQREIEEKLRRKAAGI